MVLTEQLAAQRQAAALQSFGLVGLAGSSRSTSTIARLLTLWATWRGPPDRAPRAGPALRGRDFGGREPALFLKHRGEGVGALGDVGPPVSGQSAADGESLLREGAGAVEAPEVAVQPGETRKQRRPELGPEGELAPNRGLAASRNSPRVVVSRNSSSPANGSAPKRSIRKADSSRALSRSARAASRSAGDEGDWRTANAVNAVSRRTMTAAAPTPTRCRPANLRSR